MSDNDKILELLTDAIANCNDLRTAYDPNTQSVTIVADDIAKAILPNVEAIINGEGGPRIRPEVPGLKKRRKVSIRGQLYEAFKAGVDWERSDFNDAPEDQTMDGGFERWIDSKRSAAVEKTDD